MPTSKRGRTHPDDNLFVCGYPNLRDHIAALQPRRLASILGSNDGAEWPILPGVGHLCLEIDGVDRPCNGFCHATPFHIRRLVAFSHQLRPGTKLLIHCWAGSSRSTAAALVAMAVMMSGKELEAARSLMARALQTRPNGLMVMVADEVMGPERGLVAAVEMMPGPMNVANLDRIRL